MAGTGPIAGDEAGQFLCLPAEPALVRSGPTETFRFILPPGPRASLAVAVGSSSSPTRPSEMGRRDLEGLGRRAHRLLPGEALLHHHLGESLRVRGVHGEYNWSCNTAALTMYDLAANTALWRVDLGAVPSGQQATCSRPTVHLVGLVFLVEQVQASATSAAVRVFDARGTEVIHCGLPGGVVYSGANLAGGRLILWDTSGDGRETNLFGFDSYGIQPAAHGWVSDMGNAQHDRRSR